MWPPSFVAGASEMLSERHRRNVVTAPMQLVDDLLTTVDRVDVHVPQAAAVVVETEPPPLAESVCYDDGADGCGLLRSRREPRELQAHAQLAAANVESDERPAARPAADERLDREGPEVVGVVDCEVAGLVVHF
jgi:hypothetical protein